MKKSTIISWFRYHHYNTNPCLESHQKFIGCLGALETDKWVSEHGLLGENSLSDKDLWKEILEAINQLSEEELKHVGRLIKAK